MRPSNKRSRSKQNRPRSLGNIVNRVFDSSGPEGKVRGTPQQIIDKYAVLARDAQLAGDRVAAENFQQHAEHYTRMLNEAQAELAREAEQRREQHGGNQNNNQQNGGQQNIGGQGNNQNNNHNQPHQNRRDDARDDQRSQGQGGGQSDSDNRSDNRGENRSEGRSDSRSRNRRDDRRDDRRPRDQSSQPEVSQHDPREDQGAEEDSMLVETPESRADSQPVVVSAEAPAAPAAAETPEAEPKARKPRAPRTRKPKPEVEGAAPGIAPDAAE